MSLVVSRWGSHIGRSPSSLGDGTGPWSCWCSPWNMDHGTITRTTRVRYQMILSELRNALSILNVYKCAIENVVHLIIGDWPIQSGGSFLNSVNLFTRGYRFSMANLWISQSTNHQEVVGMSQQCVHFILSTWSWNFETCKPIKTATSKETRVVKININW